MAVLESPEAAGDLYRYRGDEVPLSRPLFQGDVFVGIDIPGLDDGQGLAMVVTHACSMRRGAALNERVLVARISPSEQPVSLPWVGNYRIMPLPELIPRAAPGHWHLTFEDLGTVRTSRLNLVS